MLLARLYDVHIHCSVVYATGRGSNNYVFLCSCVYCRAPKRVGGFEVSSSQITAGAKIVLSSASLHWLPAAAHAHAFVMGCVPVCERCWRRCLTILGMPEIRTNLGKAEQMSYANVV